MKLASTNMLWLIFTIVTIGLFYRLLVHRHRYWTQKGVPQGRSPLFFGDFWKSMLRKQSTPESIESVYNISSEARYLGIYEFMKPVLVLRDPELIKQICVKDYDHFLDHRGFVLPEAEPLFGKSLFGLTGQKWKDMRSKISPAFTSSKMKYMFSLMPQTGEIFVQHLLQQKEEVVTVEMKELCSKFANDVIGNTVFGFHCDSFKDPHNLFYVLTRDASNFASFRKIVVFICSLLFSPLVKFLKLTMFSKEVSQFFAKIVKENIKSREENRVIRPDMISLLLEARKNNLNGVFPEKSFPTVEEPEIENSATRNVDITDEDIVAQAFIFVLAGFESTSSLMAFMAYEVAVNPDIQNILLQEVDQTKARCGEVLTYEAITAMKYMDMVASETLRKYPNTIALDRLCTKPYTIVPKHSNEPPLHLKKGDLLLIPVYGIQRDPKYYPEPERFDPERFSEDNRSKIVPYTYMPFGTGPRNCIGSRFALLETKILFYYLLSNFEIIPVEKTQIPIKFSKRAINMAPEKGIWLGLKRRNLQSIKSVLNKSL